MHAFAKLFFFIAKLPFARYAVIIAVGSLSAAVLVSSAFFQILFCFGATAKMTAMRFFIAINRGAESKTCDH